MHPHFGLEEGPFYYPYELIRSDIREGKPGLPLRFALELRHAKTCEPIFNGAVDVWHCDAMGLYSAFTKASLGPPPDGFGGPPPSNPGQRPPTDMGPAGAASGWPRRSSPATAVAPADTYNDSVTAADFRRIALSLPGAEEGAHMGNADFRVGGRIFATLAAERHGFGNLMLTVELQAAFLAHAPELYLPVSGGWAAWAPHIRLAGSTEQILSGALHTAWHLRQERNSAPRTRKRAMSRPPAA